MAIFVGAMNSWVETAHVARHGPGGCASVTGPLPICPGGKSARSRVRLLERRPDASLVEVTIETGRPHQIRIHLAAAGHPLVGDPLYADGGQVAASGAALPGDTGYWLHAERLALSHPATGRPCVIWCSPPPVLRATQARDMRGDRE